MYNIPDYDPDEDLILLVPELYDLEADEDEESVPRVWTWRRILMLTVALLIIAAMLVTYLLFFLPDLLFPPTPPTFPLPPGSVV